MNKAPGHTQRIDAANTVAEALLAMHAIALGRHLTDEEHAAQGREGAERLKARWNGTKGMLRELWRQRGEAPIEIVLDEVVLAWMGADTTPWDERYEMDLGTALQTCKAGIRQTVELVEGRVDPRMDALERFANPVTQSWIRRSYRLDDWRNSERAGPHPKARMGALREAIALAGKDNPACESLWEVLGMIANDAGDEETRDEVKERVTALRAERDESKGADAAHAYLGLLIVHSHLHDWGVLAEERAEAKRQGWTDPEDPDEAWDAIHETLAGGGRIALPGGAHMHWGTEDEIETAREALASADPETVQAAFHMLEEDLDEEEGSRDWNAAQSLIRDRSIRVLRAELHDGERMVWERSWWDDEDEARETVTALEEMLWIAEALTLDGNKAECDIRHVLAQAAIARGDWLEAEQLLVRSWTRAANEENALELGMWRARNGQHDEAMGLLRQGGERGREIAGELEGDDDEDEGMEDIADIREAEDTCQRHPASAQAWGDLAIVLEHHGRNLAAWGAVRAALGCMGTDTDTERIEARIVAKLASSEARHRAGELDAEARTAKDPCRKCGGPRPWTDYSWCEPCTVKELDRLRKARRNKRRGSRAWNQLDAKEERLRARVRRIRAREREDEVKLAAFKRRIGAAHTKPEA